MCDKAIGLALLLAVVLVLVTLMHNCMFAWRVNRTCLSMHCCCTITRLLSLRPAGAILNKRTDPSCCACYCRRRSGCGAVYVFKCKCTNISMHIDMRLLANLQNVCEHTRKSHPAAGRRRKLPLFVELFLFVDMSDTNNLA